MEKFATAQQRLEQHKVQIRVRDRHRDARQTRPASDVDHPLTWRQQLAYDGAVNQVALPEATHFARPQQTALHPGIRQNFRVPPSQLEPRTEHPDGDVLVEIIWFHVKHSRLGFTKTSFRSPAPSRHP